MAGEDPEIVQVNPGQTVAIKLNKQNQVTFLYLGSIRSTFECHHRCRGTN